jgi:uncharacterized protein YjdB
MSHTFRALPLVARHSCTSPFARLTGSGVLCLLLVACGGGGGGGDDPTTPTVVSEVTITRPSESVPAGGSVTLTAALRDASGRPVAGTVTWLSSDPGIATVTANGVVLGISPGQVTITASAGGVSSTVILVIRATRAITSVTVTPSTASAVIGESITFAANIVQPNAAPAPRVRWSTSNAAVATVNQNGAVTGVSAGTAVISADVLTDPLSGYTADSVRASGSITVQPPVPAITVLTVSPTSAQLNATNTLQLGVSVQRANVNVQTTFTYGSSRESVATVSASGLVTGVDAGTATITVTAQAPAGLGVAATTLTQAATITVVKPGSITGLTVQPQGTISLFVGATQTLVPSVTQPAGAATAVVTYTSSLPGVASVSNGVVTGLSPGAANIVVTATAAATPAFTASVASTIVQVIVASPSLTLQGVVQGATRTIGLDSLTTAGSIRGIRASVNPQAGFPIDVTNTRDEIVVSAATSTALDSVALEFTDVGGGNPVMLGTRRGGVAAGIVSVTGNTAEFTIDAPAGTASARLLNGSRSMRMVGWYRGVGGATQSVATSAVPLQINNLDGFALQLTPPIRTAVDAGGRTWTGGGGANGAGTFTVIPVIYTPGRTISSVTLSFGRCPGSVTKNAAPFRATFGGAGSGADISCTAIIGGSDPADGFRAEDYPMVTASADNIGGSGAGPRVTYVYDPGAGAHPWAGPRPSLWRASLTFVSPPAIRVDYTGVIVPP